MEEVKMKKQLIITTILLLICLYISAQEKLRSLYGVKIGDTKQQVIEKLGEPPSVDTKLDMKSLNYYKDGKDMAILIQNEKVQAFFVQFSEFIPRARLKLDERGFTSEKSDEGYWIYDKEYSYGKETIYESFISSRKNRNWILTRSVGIKQKESE